MLDQEQVDKEEELIRLKINTLTDKQRAFFYKKVKTKIKDPDTYSVLNWFFICGIHHFYLKNWRMGFIVLTAFVGGLLLIITGFIFSGFFIILLISVIELWDLFRSQVIIQNWNNQMYQQILLDAQNL